MTHPPPDDSHQRAPHVVVIGRANIDITVRIPHRPVPGRTTFASAPATTTAGGKSLNQALAARRAGAHVSLISNAGADHWGAFLRQTLTDAAIDTTFFQLIPSAPTGIAIVEVTPDAENHIVLALPPATELTAAHIHDALPTLRAPVVVTQLDIHPEAVDAVLRHHHAEILIGNLVPHPALESDALAALDILVANEHETAAILGRHHTDPTTAADHLRALGPRTAIVTAGHRGAAYSNPHHTGLITPPPTHATNTTGAGDVLLGTLATRLAQHTPLPHAINDAVTAATKHVAD
ncbi:PfkB family carbohydrate kinase [Solwaraspora sp. WMMD1047]|uniref:PfkB family carbohydrate kinase n=1 Tax=Solwaraspora sp. WMMD1047 TaxID=3016102 RepID=UPI002416F852|nr:PfkB family carbohydrate kinase [Solwaraspora sp. WMMD1047]MDG4833787.1 PfkB family carbohydrate kinase [Solwaraspora sp. WMMD1047]